MVPESESIGSAEGEIVQLDDLYFAPLIPAERIAREVSALGARLAERLDDLRPLVLCVLNGAVPFHTDLVRAMPLPLEVDYIRASSYSGGVRSSGSVEVCGEPRTKVEGRYVMVVEDIVDTGRTAAALRQWLHQRGALKVEVAALLFKPDALVVGPAPEHVVFTIPDRFVVGYGLDYHELGRNLPAIHARVER